MKARIITDDGWETVRCIWRKRGLAVTKAWDEPGWTLTHVATGRSVGSLTTGLASPHVATDLAELLASTVDWRSIRDPMPTAQRAELGPFVRAALEMFEVIPS